MGREIYIERTDFMEDPPPRYHRLRPGGEVRLRYAYILKCVGAERDARGGISFLRAVVDPGSRHGGQGSRRRVKGTIHWVSVRHSVEAEVRLVGRLFSEADPSGDDFMDHIDPGSLAVLRGCRLEPSLAHAVPGVPYQWERLGYFCLDGKDSRKGGPVFNRTIPLRSRIPGQAQERRAGGR